jgi:cell division protease FtsH
MGGRAAEAILFQDVTGGAANDLEKASEIATNMVTRWGMGHDPDSVDPGVSGRGTLSLRVVADDASVSTGVRAAMDRAINATLDQAYTQAREALLTEMKRLTRVAAFLYEHERIDGAQFDALYEGTLAPSADSEKQWRSAKSQPRSWDEIDNLIATSGATTETSTAPRTVAPSATRLSKTRPHRAWSSTARLVLLHWLQRGSPGVDRAAK